MFKIDRDELVQRVTECMPAKGADQFRNWLWCFNTDSWEIADGRMREALGFGVESPNGVCVKFFLDQLGLTVHTSNAQVLLLTELGMAVYAELMRMSPVVTLPTSDFAL